MHTLIYVPSHFAVNVGQNTFLRIVLLILFMGYVGFLAPGPYPIMLWGAKLDHLFAVATALLSVFLIPTRFPRGLALVYGSIFLVLFSASLTTITSTEPNPSLKGLSGYIIYSTIALCVPLTLYRYTVVLRKYIFIMATLTAMLILYLNFFHHDIGRMRLHLRVDPNMTSIGMLMSLIIYLPEYYKKKHVGVIGKAFYILSFSMVLAAVIVLLSRTALLSFMLALILSSLLLWMKRKSISWRYVGKKMMLYGVAVAAGIMILHYLKPDVVVKYEQRVERIFSGNFAPTESNRIMRARNTLNWWSESLKTIILGKGFFSINPHNEILRVLGGSGLLGLGSFLIMLSVFYWKCCSTRGMSTSFVLGQNALYFFIIFMIQFYGHTKSMWVGLTFILINYLSAKRQQLGFTSVRNLSKSRC